MINNGNGKEDRKQKDRKQKELSKKECNEKEFSEEERPEKEFFQLDRAWQGEETAHQADIAMLARV